VSKTELKWLEKVWAAEVEGRLPLQSRAAIYKRLEDRGLVERMKVEYPPDRFGPIVVEGWGLTHAGRFVYCSSCNDSQDR
jgi:hypothetical protein